MEIELVAGFVPKKRALDHRMKSNGQDSNPRSPRAFWAESRCGRRREAALGWTQSSRGPGRTGRFSQEIRPATVFPLKYSLYFFPEAYSIFFCSDFGQISYTFFLFKIIQRNFGLGNKKVTEMFLKSIKLIEFFNSCFPLQIEKCALLNLKGQKEHL